MLSTGNHSSMTLNTSLFIIHPTKNKNCLNFWSWVQLMCHQAQADWPWLASWHVQVFPLFLWLPFLFQQLSHFLLVTSLAEGARLMVHEREKKTFQMWVPPHFCRILCQWVEHSLSWQHVNSRAVQHGPLPTANLPLSSLLQSHSFVSSLLGCISLLVKLLLPFLGLLTGLLTLVSTCKSRMKNVKTSPLRPEVFYLLCVIALVTLKVVPTWSSDSGFNHDAGFSVTSTHLHQCTAINSLNLRCKKYVQ